MLPDQLPQLKEQLRCEIVRLIEMAGPSMAELL
jgi:hypothetical protein